jgi:FKBP-type peptidyl-prolyl cis-trans isomerase SlyD
VNRIRNVAVVVGLAVALGAGAVGAEEPATTPTPSVQDNMDIGMEYTLTVDGEVVDSSEGKDAFHYIHGQQQIVPGLEKQLTGMKIGEIKDVTISPAEGYGDIDPAGIVELPKDKLPTDIQAEVGMVLRGMSPDGQGFQAQIKEIKEDKVVLDLNHPLAGKTLNFKVKITDISPVPTP